MQSSASGDDVYERSGWKPDMSVAGYVAELLTAANDPRADHAAISAQLQALGCVDVPRGGGKDALSSSSSSSEQQQQQQQQGGGAGGTRGSVPDLEQYLVTVLAWEQLWAPSKIIVTDETARESAGLLLKNNLRRSATCAGMSANGMAYLKATLLECMFLPSPRLKRTSSSCIAALVTVTGLETWPELVGILPRFICTGNETALDTLHEILEESKMLEEKGLRQEALCLECKVEGYQEATATALFVPALLRVAMANNVTPNQARLSIKSLNTIASYMPRALIEEMNGYRGALLARAMDANTNVRIAVCQGLVSLLSLYPMVLEQSWDQLVDYMIKTMADASVPELALESCEFWIAYCEAALPAASLQKRLADLVTVLLKNMAYADDDEEVFEVEEEESQIRRGQVVRDRDEELKPFFGKGKQATNSTADDENDDDDDDGDDDYTSYWNLRKCSAASLDALSDLFANDPTLLSVVLNESQARLGTREWRMIEAATLALGAIATGCSEGMRAHVPSLVQWLLPQLTHEHPMIRSISCWSLSRYACLLGETAETEPGRQLMDSVINGVLTRMHDPNRKVQESACSAISSLAEDSEIMPGIATCLVARLPHIAHSLAHGLNSYGRRTLPNLMDTLGTLAEKLASALADPGVSNVLMPAFMSRWNAIADSDQSLLPLIEGLTNLAQAMGMSIAPFAEAFLKRADTICKVQLNIRSADTSSCDRNFVMLTLDLTAQIVETIGADLESLLVTMRTAETAAAWTNDSDPSVRQSAFALIGDLATAIPKQVVAIAPHCFTLATAMLESSQLTPENIGASNNVCWAVGELALVVPRDAVQGTAVALVERLVGIMTATKVVKSLFENAAITLGRIALACPEPLAPHLDHFITPWCYGLCRISDNIEKEHAFSGLFRLIRLNPATLGAGIVPLSCSIASWQQVKNLELRSEMKETLLVYKAGVPPEQWDSVMSNLGAYKARVETIIM